MEEERERERRARESERARNRESERAREVMVTTRSSRHLLSLETLGHFVACVCARLGGLSGVAKEERFFVFRMLYTTPECIFKSLVRERVSERTSTSVSHTSYPGSQN